MVSALSLLRAVGQFVGEICCALVVEANVLLGTTWV
jgi:hypothetical protein